MDTNLYDYRKNYFKIVYGENNTKKYYFFINKEYIEVSEEIFKICKRDYDRNRYYYKNQVDRSIVVFDNIDLSTFYVVNRGIQIDYTKDIFIHDLVNQIKKDISYLPELDRRIAECIFINEMSIRETAQYLDIPKSTISYRAIIIRKKIKEKYMNIWTDDE